MLCGHCNANSPAGTRFCDSCGQPLQPACTVCGQFNRPNARFCGGCGRKLARDAGFLGANDVFTPALPAPLAALLSSRFAREGERKQVTVLFADIRGSTELIQELDPEQGMQRLQPAMDAMAKAIHQYGGTVSRLQGDGVMALFGAPLAFEDHAVRACLSAQAMLDAMTGLGEHGVQIRVGLNSGEVVVQSVGHDLSMEYSAIGPTTHLASRMEQFATPGTACITARTARLAGGFVQVRTRGMVDIKGVAQPVEVFELAGVASHSRWQVRAAAHGLTQFVGRATPLRMLSDALRCAADGTGQVVAVAGEAGMGKSRLVHEFLQAPGQDNLPSLSGAASPHDQNTPYYLIAQMLRTWLAVESDDSQAEISGRLDAAMATLGDQYGAFTTPLRSLLDLPVHEAGWLTLDPAQQRQRIHAAVRSIVLQAAASTPFIVVAEDMHWVDSESQSVLDDLVDGLGAAHLLVIVTYRPEYQNRWARHSYYSLVQLGPLEGSARSAMLKSLLGDADDLDPLRSRLIEQTDGTPLFLEEMARTLVETGILVSEPSRFRLTRKAQDVEIPDSIQIVIASRIDRLPSEARTLLQIASVIGTDVPVALLRAVAAIPADQLTRQLLDLRAQEFLQEAAGPASGEYTFKHALTHAVTYDSMLVRHRRALHGEIVAAIEQHFPERLEEYTERLADHALRGEMWAKAAFYAFRAGQRANSRSAHRAATIAFQNALDATARLPQDTAAVHQAIDIRLGMRVALAATGDLDQVRGHLDEAEKLARSIHDERRLMPILISRSIILNNLGDLDQAMEAGVAGRMLAERFNDEACLTSAAFALGQAFWNRGEFQQAEQVLSQALDALEGGVRKQNAGTTGTAPLMCLVSLSHTYSLSGQFKRAFAQSRKALELAMETGRPYDLSYAHSAQGLAHLTAGELNDAIRHLEEASRISQTHEIMLLVPHSARYLGRAYALAGRLDEADAVLEAAVEQTRSQSLTALWAWCSAALGLSRLLRGAHDEAAALVSDALAFARRQGYQPLEARALRLMGMIGTAGDAASAQPAKAWFRDAAAVARKIGMRPELAHCHYGLGALLAGADQAGEARRELSAALDLYGVLGMAADTARVEAALGALSGDKPAERRAANRWLDDVTCNPDRRTTMAQTPTSSTPLEGLKAVLEKAKRDEDFRDKLLSSPAETLEAEGLNLDRKWVDLLRTLNAGNFDLELQRAITNEAASEASEASQ